MRRILGGLLPLFMAGAAMFAAAPAATAATVHVQAACTYGPCGTQGQVAVTVTYNGSIVTLHITGTGFKPGEQVNISVTLPSRAVGAFVADSTGSFSGPITLPGGYARGNHGLEALGTTSGTVASTSFYLSETSGTITPCVASYSTSHTTGIVLAAAYLSAACKTAAPAASAGGLPVSGAPSSAVASVTHASSASQLPFTGFNAATAAASGAILLGAGGGLVLVSRKRRRNAWQ